MRLYERKKRPPLSATNILSSYVAGLMALDGYPIDEYCRTTNMMRLLLVLVEQVCEQLLVLPRLVSTLRVYRSSSPREVILLLPKVVSMLR